MCQRSPFVKFELMCDCYFAYLWALFVMLIGVLLIIVDDIVIVVVVVAAVIAFVLYVCCTGIRTCHVK